MKKIILILMAIIFVSLSFGQKKYRARWKKERFSFGVIGYGNTPILKDEFGVKLSLSTRVLYFTSIETSVVSNTEEISGELNVKLYIIPKKYLRTLLFQRKTINKRIYLYVNTQIDTYKNIGTGIGLGYNINNKWRCELRVANVFSKIDKKKVNPVLGFGFYRNLNFHEYPPKRSSKY